MRDETLVGPADVFTTTRTLPHGHVEAVLGLIRKLGVDRLISSTPSRERDLIVALVTARILFPSSKLATSRLFSSCTLAEELGLGDETDVDELYDALDWLLERQGRIEKKLARRHLGNSSRALYDLSSSFYYGRHCPLAALGHNRDGKRDTLIIEYGLLTDGQGRPVAISVYRGNRSDSTTVPDQVAKLQEEFGLHPEKVRAVYLHDTTVNPADFFRQLALELGLEPHWSRALGFRSVQQEIVRLVEERRLSVLLVIDEAHHLRPDLLALLPQLTNFDWDGQSRLALLLAGQSGLRNKLRLAHLEPLAQRISVRYALPRLDRDNARLYLEHRLRLAGLDRPLFSEPAVEALFSASGGLMRHLDTLAHHALAAAASLRAQIVDGDHVVRAAEELRA